MVMMIMEILEMARKAKQAALKLASVDGALKNNALQKITEILDGRREEIFHHNELDLQAASLEKLAQPLQKRLKFDGTKLDAVLSGIQSLIDLPEPVGKTLMATELDRGLELYRVSCPIGVIGVIFESRPDALIQISTLGLKSGNAVLLKGGREARHTNRILAQLIDEATASAGMPQGWIQLLESREDVNALLTMDHEVDLIIPRGSNEFVRYIMDHSRIPVLGHADGICHCYVDADADVEMAVRIVEDSKTQYVAVCNATETLLVHQKMAPVFLPRLKEALDRKQVELVGCDQSRTMIPVAAATEADWKTEYLDYKLAVKVVNSLADAIRHINTYGSGHTDCIVTRDARQAEAFMDGVDSGNVFWNCSTRFSDGFRYGFGAEVGISTSKIHARGPVGLEGLLSYKYKLIGSGQIVADYATGQKRFTHKPLNKSYQKAP